MAYQKIDDEKLQRLLAEGKYVNEIAEEFGVHHTAVRRHIKIHGLTPNSSRKHHGVAAKPAPAPSPAPVRESAVDPTYKRFAPPVPSKEGAMAEGVTPVQIIPVVLRLTVEVNVRVSAQGCS